MAIPKSRSVERLSRTALNQDAKARKKKNVADSFVNFTYNMGVGADNALSTSNYGFNPITRNRTLLEWIHRGSWIGGLAVDVVADDMTRAGVQLLGNLKPDYIEAIEEQAVTLDIWGKLNETISWDRLYGGCLAVLLIDGQDFSTPLRPKTVRADQFRGILPLDRWMVNPSLNDLVTDMGPHMGQPKYYTVTALAPGLVGQVIHHTRVVRMDGLKLPYWQKLQENLWGISVLERLYDRMIAFDSATTGAAQLVYKSYIRTYKVDSLRNIVAAGGPAYSGLMSYVDMMRRFQAIEGMVLIDKEDEFEAMTHSAFSGLSDALQQFGQQISGALQIPLVRLFGQSPAGFSSGESDLRSYYDGINHKQVKSLHVAVTLIYRMIAQSLGIAIPDGFKIKFNSLWQLSDSEKADIANKTADAVDKVAGIVSRRTQMQELRQSSSVTGIFTNITPEDIESADDDLPPSPEEMLEKQEAANNVPGTGPGSGEGSHKETKGSSGAE